MCNSFALIRVTECKDTTNELLLSLVWWWWWCAQHTKTKLRITGTTTTRITHTARLDRQTDTQRASERAEKETWGIYCARIAAVSDTMIQWRRRRGRDWRGLLLVRGQALLQSLNAPLVALHDYFHLPNVVQHVLQVDALQTVRKSQRLEENNI